MAILDYKSFLAVPSPHPFPPPPPVHSQSELGVLQEPSNSCHWQKQEGSISAVAWGSLPLEFLHLESTSIDSELLWQKVQSQQAVSPSYQQCRPA